MKRSDEGYGNRFTHKRLRGPPLKLPPLDPPTVKDSKVLFRSRDLVALNDQDDDDVKPLPRKKGGKSNYSMTPDQLPIRNSKKSGPSRKAQQQQQQPLKSNPSPTIPKKTKVERLDMKTLESKNRQLYNSHLRSSNFHDSSTPVYSSLDSSYDYAELQALPFEQGYNGLKRDREMLRNNNKYTTPHTLHHVPTRRRTEKI